MALTHNSEPPQVFRKWVGLSVLAAALQRKCWIELGDLKFYPNLYAVLVGQSANTRKSTAMRQGRYFLDKLGIQCTADTITKEALTQFMAESEQCIGDGLLIRNHCSITIFSSELVVFLNTKDPLFMAQLTDWYDCADQWIYKTKHNSTDIINGVWVNLLGCTTPELLRSLPKEVIGGGFASRVCFVFSEGREKKVPIPFLSPGELDLRDKLEDDLTQVLMLSGRFAYDDTFKEVYIDWYMNDDNKPEFRTDKFEAYLGRRQSHALKLSMLFCAARSNQMIITGEDLIASIKTLEQIESNMEYIFSGVGKRVEAETVMRVALYIKQQKKVTFPALLNRFSDDASLEDLWKYLRELEAKGFLTREGEGSELTVTYNPSGK